MAMHQLKSLRYKATHRGTKENDVLMGWFVRDYLEKLDKEQLITFSSFLEESDDAIFSWIIKKKATPLSYVWIIDLMGKKLNGH
ncbi:MAG: succinate dehydrogenase assembly factor 2 [Alphaproteobacteria bacterium]|nr:succinate dehydrogenase assembly factor 2 [Alphaproteobacteria bacterium]